MEFAPVDGLGRLGPYFGLKEGLEALLGRPFDLVTPEGLANPYFAESVQRTRQVLHAE